MPVSRSPVKGPSPETLRTDHLREKRSIPRASFIHLSKSLVDEPLSRFPSGAPMERDAHLQSLFYLSRVPSSEPSLQVPQWGSYGKRCPPPEPFLPLLQGPQQVSPPSRFPTQSSHRGKFPTSRAPVTHLSKSPVDGPTPGCPAEPQ
jgi:hypothetical protein